MKPYIVKQLLLEGWEEKIVGLWLAENDNWLLLRRVYDYRPDGYLLVAKKFIARYIAKGNTQTARVLRLKGISSEVPEGFVFADAPDLLRHIEQHYTLFQISDEEDTTFCGQLRDYDQTHFRINSLSPRAEFDLDYDVWFGFEKLMTIEFSNDYLDSLLLLWRDKAKRKWKINRPSQSN